MTVTVKPAQQQDAKRIYAMVHDMAHILNEEKYLENTEQQFIDDWGKYEALIAVDDDDNLMGFLSYSYFYLSWQGNSIYLDDVYVGEEFRRQNIATLLMDALFDIAKSEKIHCVRWYVLKNNEAAVTFYKKYGVSFEENRYRCNYFVDTSKS